MTDAEDVLCGMLTDVRGERNDLRRRMARVERRIRHIEHADDPDAPGCLRGCLRCELNVALR